MILQQHEEQLVDFKELADIWTSLLSVDLEDGDELCKLQTSLDKAQFECSLSIMKTLTHVLPPTDE